MTLFARAVSVYALVFTALFSIHALAQPPKPAGTVLFVHGDVAIVSSAGERRSAERGASVYEGDKIISSAASSMQIKMVDSGYLAIRPSTEIRIDKYQFDQSQNDKAETSLLRGGLRSITGSIGKTRKENFKLRTPVATIGIRGTDLEVFYVPSSRNELLAKGAYLRINSGKGYLQTFAGVQFVNPNQTGFVGSSQSAPQILKTAPKIFNQPEQDFLPEEKNVSGNADVSESDGSTSDDSNPVAGKGRDNKGDADQVADVFEESESPQLVQDDASFTESEEELVDLALPPDLQESWNSDSDASPEPELNVPTEDIEFGVIGDATPETTVAAQTGVFNYSVSSTGLGVSEGTLNTAGSSTKLNIDFDNDLVVYDLQLDFSSPAGVQPAAVSGDNGGMWIFSGSGALGDFTGDSGLTLAGTYSENETSQSAKGKWYGFFTGGNADGLFSSFELESGIYSVFGFVESSTRASTDYLAGLELLSGVNGYILNDTAVNPLSGYTLYQGGSGLAALENPTTGEQWVAASTAASEALLGDATVTWGSWNTWRQINDQTLIQYSTPIQYIHSNQLTDAEIPANLQGTYHFNTLRGQAYDQVGANGGLVSGNLSVDFTQQNASLDMSGLLGTDTWGAYGSDSLTNLYSGNFALTGSRLDGVAAESLSGTAQGQFAGSNADGLFGYYQLAGSKSQIEGVYAFGDRQLNDYLAKMTLLNGANGYVLNSTTVNPLSDYTLYQGGNGLAALENPTTGEQWVAASTATSGTTLGDATVTWGSWNTWRQINDQTLIEHSTPIQYIHSSQLTDAAIPANLQGIYHFNAVNGQVFDNTGTEGVLSDGNLSIDFTNQQADLGLNGSVGNDSWSAYGTDSLSNLYAGQFALNGDRYDGVTAESLSGTAQGQFAGSNADGLFGYYQLAGSKSQIEGVYAFGDRQLNDYLAKMTLLNGVNGYVLNGTTVNPLSDYTLYQGGNGLAALANPTTGEQWGAAATATSGTTLGDATVTWGSWNTWRQINDQTLIEHSSPIQYIHSNQLTDAVIPANLQGIYHFNAVNGVAQDGAGAQGSLSNGHLSIDFTNQQADLGLNGSLGNDSWSAYGTGSLSNLYAGQFALNGDRYDGVTAESLSGTAQGQFAGSNADGLFGYYHLAGSSSQINGVYAFGDRQLNDYLAKMTLLNGMNGYVLNGTTVNPLSDYTLYQGSNGLAALENPDTNEQWVASSTATSGTTLGDATVTWGSWNTWRQINDQALIEQTTPIQYIYSNQLTDAAIPASLQGVYHFNSVSGQAYDQSGANGGIQAGNLTIDFTQQQASLDLSGALGSDSWGAYGSDSLRNLYAGSFALRGSRFDGVTTESLSGSAQGQFAGSSGEGLFGYYQLAGSSSQINGVYAFGERQLNDYLLGMTILSDIDGYVISSGASSPLSNFTLYQSSNGLLTAVVDPNSFEQWVVANSGGESTTEQGGATVIWGSWNSWRKIQGQTLSEQLNRVQYIHSDILTDSAIPTSLQGIYHFKTLSGILQDDIGNTGILQNGGLSIDFTQQNASLDFSGSLGPDTWGVYGSDSLNNLYAGNFVLTGSRYDGVVVETLNGTAQGQFAGSNADGLFGHFHLNGSSSQIEGVYVFGDRHLNDYLAGMAELRGVVGYILNDGNNYSLSDFSLYKDDTALAAVFYPVTAGQWVAASNAASEALLGDATVTWGSWNTWRQINGHALIEQSTPIQYIYTDVLTDSSIVANHENVFSLTSVGGSAHNQSGEISLAITSSMTIDFIDQDVDIALELAFSDSQWAMSGSGVISEVTGSGMALIGERYDATERVYESAYGVVIGDFFGSGLEGLAGFYQLSSATDFADGSLVLAKDLQLNEKRVLSGNHLAFFSDTQTGFYGASDQGAVFTTLDGNLLRVAKDGVTTEAQGSDVLFGATASSALNQINWGYWDGFVVDEGTNAEQYFDQKRYFGLIDSTSLHTFSSAGRANMQAKFSLLGAVGHDINGTQLTFDQANSYLMLDFNTSVMSGQLEMTAGSVDGAHDRWSLYTGYYSLNDIVSGEGSVALYGDVLSLDAQGSQIGSGYVDGYWDFVWSGDRSDILMGGFNVWELSEIGPGNYASSGLVVFSDPSAQNVVLEGSEFSGLVSGFSDELGWGVGFVFDPASSNSLSGYYVSESDPRYLVGAFNDNQGISINSSSAQLFEDISSYEVLGDAYSGQADGVYSAAGSNVILDADGANAANVQWGRWGTQADDDILFGNGEGIGSLDVLHYISADVATPASALEGLINDYAYASFSFAGGTAPTLTKRDITGEVKVELGSVDVMELNVDFGSGYVDTYMELSFTRGNISALGSGDLVSFTSGGIDTQVYEFGEIPVGRGTVEGIFVGPNADGAIISYDMNTEFGEINGAAALQKTYQQSNAGQLP